MEQIGRRNQAEWDGVKDIKNFVQSPGLLGLGLGLEARFSGLGLETSGLGLEAFGLGLVFLALASFKAKAKVKVTNILPNTVYHGIITLTVHWYTSVSVTYL